jgi:hypothetical protein
LYCVFFILIVIKYDWCDIKSVKKLECFLFDFLGEVKRKRGRVENGLLT